MSIRFTCPNPKCGHSDKARDDFAGQKVKCPKCGWVLRVPDPNAPYAAGVAPPPAAPAAAAAPSADWWKDKPPDPPADSTATPFPGVPAVVPPPANGNGTHAPPKPPAAKLPPPPKPPAPAAKPPAAWDPGAALPPGGPTTDAIAASLLSDNPPPAPAADGQTGPAKPPAGGKMIAVECRQCDHKFEVDSSKAGKNVPCAECGKLVKVPTLDDLKPKTWRDAGKDRPSMARVDTEPAPEGAWSGATVVSAEAVRQAAQLHDDEDDEPRTWLGFAARTALFLAVAAGLVFGVLLVLRYRNEAKQEGVLEQSLKVVSDEKNAAGLSPQQKAAVYLLAARHARLGGDPKEALARLDLARASLVRAAPSAERSLLLGEVASELARLFDEPVEMDRRTASWNADAVARRLGQTLTSLPADTGTDREVRLDAGRRLARQALKEQSLTDDAWGHFLRAVKISAHDPDRPEVLAGVGIELAAAGRKDEAKGLANDAEVVIKSRNKLPNGQQAPRPPTPTLLGLYALLGQAEQKGPPSPASRLGHSEALVRSGRADEARKLAMTRLGNEPPDEMLRALAAVAEADELRPADVEWVQKHLPDAPWPNGRRPLVLYRLARLAGAAGKGDAARAFADRIADTSLKSYAWLEAYRGDLAAADGPAPPVPEALEKLAAAGSAPAGLARAYASRHDALRGGKDPMPAARALDDKLRPFAVAGVALGWQAAAPNKTTP